MAPRSTHLNTKSQVLRILQNIRYLAIGLIDPVRPRVSNGVPTRTLDELNSPVATSRSFDYFESFYSIYKSGKRVFVLEERPNSLKTGLIPTQKDLQKHRTFQKRLENNPIKKAEYFQRLMESTGASSIRQLAEMTGEDWSYIAKLLRILELPQGIRDFLVKNPFPEIVKYFHLRRLLEILNIKDEDHQMSRFREICENCQDVNSRG